MKLFFLLLLIPFVGLGQNICHLRVIVSGAPMPLQLIIRHANGVDTGKFQGNTVQVNDTIGQPRLETLVFKSLGNYPRWSIKVFLAPGDVTVRLTHQTNFEISDLKVDGPPLNIALNDLDTRVSRYNNEIEALRDDLSHRGPDSVKQKSELNKVIHLCFGVPRDYVRQNPDSQIDIFVLQKMGHGDPTVAHPVEELKTLFHSLSAEIQNSEDGKKYADMLSKLQDK